MKELRNAWSGNWSGRILTRVREIGFTSLSQFLREFPSDTYLDLANRLGKTNGSNVTDVAATQVQHVQFSEIFNQEQLREAAMNSLVRLLRQHVKRGWNKGPNAEFNRASAKVAWFSLVRSASQAIAPSVSIEAIWNQLESLNPPKEWTPRDSTDKFIQDIFSTSWPTDS